MIKKSEMQKIHDEKPDLYRLRTLSKEQLMACVRLSESRDGKVFLDLIDNYIFNRMAEVFYNRDINPTSRIALATFDQGRGAGVAEIKLLLKTANKELAKREK